MRKRLYVKAAAVALSVLMACSMTGCKDKKVDYSLDEKDGSVKNEQEKDGLFSDPVFLWSFMFIAVLIVVLIIVGIVLAIKNRI